LFFSSLAGGRIFRAAPGATEATEWIKQGTNGLASALGVLADEKSRTLYVCSVDLSGGGINIPTGALKMFDLRTGAAQGCIFELVSGPPASASEVVDDDRHSANGRLGENCSPTPFRHPTVA
jgi:hypothetical protein